MGPNGVLKKIYFNFFLKKFCGTSVELVDANALFNLFFLKKKI